MKHVLYLVAIVALVLPAPLSAGVVGEASPLTDGTPDGWSGITVMSGYGGIPAGENVSAVNYYANPGRANADANVQPLIVKEDAGTFTIWEVGPAVVADTAGENVINWTSGAIPSDGLTYHPAFWQWRSGVDNTEGGVVSFADGGSGMFQHDEDGTTYVPMVGDEVTMQHASGEGGRAYQFNMTTVPEPTSLMLAALAFLPLMLLRRKK